MSRLPSRFGVDCGAGFIVSTFIWSILILFAIETVGLLIWLTMEEVPQRTKGSIAVDIFFSVIFICWGAIVLAKAQ